MTIGGWIIVVFVWLIILVAAIATICFNYDRPVVIILTVVLGLSLIIGIYALANWYYTSTASGIRALTDERSELMNGLERTVTIYTANGDKIAEYKGKIDLEMDQDYIKFDWQGKRYIYYNCFVETIADIP